MNQTTTNERWRKKEHNTREQKKDEECYEKSTLVFILFHAYQNNCLKHFSITSTFSLFRSSLLFSIRLFCALVKWSVQHKLFSSYFLCLLPCSIIRFILFTDWIFRISIQIGWYYRNYLSYTSENAWFFISCKKWRKEKNTVNDE